MRIEHDMVHDGYFWLPGNEDHRVPGTVYIKENEKIYVDLKGHLNADADDFSNNEFDVVYGFVEKLNDITLLNCFYLNQKFTFGAYSNGYSKLLANYVYSGALLPNPQNVLLDSIVFSCDHLDEWVGVSGINVEIKKKDEVHTISYKKPESIMIPLDDDITLSIEFSYSIPGFPNISEAKFTQKTFLKLASKKPLKISDFESLAYKIISFISLAVGLPLIISNISGILHQHNDSSLVEAPVSKSIKVFYLSANYCEKKKISFNEMNFRFVQVNSEIRTYINNWVNFYDGMSPAISLYFSSFSGRNNLADARFLSLAQGLETYHRRTSTEKYMNDDDFIKLLEVIMKNCPEEHVSWLKGRVTYGNEISLHKRLIRLMSPFSSIIGGNKNVDKWARKITTTRNYKTHYNPSIEKSALSGRDLYKLIIFIECIFVFLFLKEIGFTNELIIRLSSNPSNSLTRNFKYAVSK